jgi:cell division protein FtsQ
MASAGTSEAERTVRVARKRFARRQWARRWLAWRRVLAVVAVLAAVAALTWLVFFSSVTRVSGVEVRGVYVLSERDVRAAAAVPEGGRLATLDLGAVAARVEALAPVRSVEVTRSWPDHVRIAVQEREAVAVAEREGVVRGLDEDGVLFRTYAEAPPGLPRVLMSARTEAEALAGAASVVGALPPEVERRVDYLTVRTVDSIAMRLRDGSTVFWGSAGDSGAKAEVLRALLKVSPDAAAYDVSVPGQPTTRG